MQEKHCSRCGATFGCGRDEASCWCVALPLLPRDRLDPAADCLCPRCLAAAVDDATAAPTETDIDARAADPDPHA